MGHTASYLYNDRLMQDCSSSITDALQLLQSCAKPSICVEKTEIHTDNIGFWLWLGARSQQVITLANGETKNNNMLSHIWTAVDIAS